jgi:arginine decarboxylase
MSDPQTSAIPSPLRSQEDLPYVDAVRAYAAKDFLRLDVPGHTGSAATQPELAELFGESVLALDVPPLVDGIDQGPVPTPMQQSARLAAEAWGAHRTWLLTNGASKGNLVTCLALRHVGQLIVAQRSMHSSVMDGMVLGGLEGHFIQPVIDVGLGAAHGITAESLAEALDTFPGATAAYVVSPSYFGAVSDIRALADIAHSRACALVVDGAWGSHFGFHPDLPLNALAEGADIMISSTHKLGGSLTQSAMLHLGNGPFVDLFEPLVNRAFRSMQSTRASSILMMSLDVARRNLAVHGKERVSQSIEAANRLRQGVQEAGRFEELSDRFLRSPGIVAVDPLRVVIDTRRGGISGHEARKILFHEHRIHVEMATDSAIVAVVGAGSAPDMDRMLQALGELPDVGAADTPLIALPEPGEAVMSLREAYFSPSQLVPTSECIGRISAESLAAYPPGIPNLLPGEIITEQVIDFLLRTARSPFGHVRGVARPDLSCVRVLTK